MPGQARHDDVGRLGRLYLAARNAANAADVRARARAELESNKVHKVYTIEGMRFPSTAAFESRADGGGETSPSLRHKNSTVGQNFLESDERSLADIIRASLVRDAVFLNRHVGAAYDKPFALGLFGSPPLVILE